MKVNRHDSSNIPYVQAPLLSDAIYQSESSIEMDDFRRYGKADVIHREFESDGDKPRVSRWIYLCTMKAVTLTVAPVISVVLPSFLILLCGILFLNVCYQVNFHLKELPRFMLQIVFYSTLTETFLVHFWFFVILCFTFPKKTIRKCNLFYVTLAFAQLELLVLAIEFALNYGNVFDTNGSRVIFMSSTIMLGFQIAGYYEKRKLIRTSLAFKICFQYLLGIILYIIVISYGVKKFIAMDSDKERLIFATFFPLTGTFFKLLCRLIAGAFPKIIHPGKYHLLVVTMNVGVSITYRIFQAKIVSMEHFTMLSIFHAATGCIGRCTLLYRDRFYRFVLRVCRSKVSTKSRTKAIERRFTADLIITDHLSEIMSVIVINMLVYMYSLHFQIPINKKDVVIAYVNSFLKRVGISLSLEFIFLVPSLVLLTYHLNLPILKLWRKYWKSYLLVTTFCSCMTLLYAQDRNQLTQLVEESLVKSSRQSTNGSFPWYCNETKGIGFWRH